MHRRMFFIGLLFPATARAHSYRLGHIAIGHAWALPSRLSDGQMFFPMVNNGIKGDELVAARSAVCSLIEFRRNNRYVDPPPPSIAIAPGQPVPMRPTALHLRLIGLKRQLASGGRFAVILDFLNAGEIEIEVMVEEKPGD